MVTITISGSPGSGKSTVAKLLAKKTGLNYVYTGDMFRKLADQHNMSLGEFGKYCEHNKEIDEQLDAHQQKIMQKGDVIVEGRIAGWIAYRNNIPAIKVMLNADLETRTRRIINRERGSIETRKKEIQTREKSEASRYNKYYAIDLSDESIYDLVINTSTKTPEEIVALITQKIRR